MLTTKQVLEVLKGRGIVTSYPTVAAWVREGKFANAKREETPRGVVWYIPRKSVLEFEPPKMGRPLKAENKKAINENKKG